MTMSPVPLFWLTHVVLPAPGGPTTSAMRGRAVRHFSFCVLSTRWLLQFAQLARRLAGSNHEPFCDAGMMWSTWVAIDVQPGALIWQMYPSRLRICSLSFRQGPEYWDFAIQVSLRSGWTVLNLARWVFEIV
jgi:hypothetical protein